MKYFDIIIASLMLSLVLCSCINSTNTDTPATVNIVESTATSIPGANKSLKNSTTSTPDITDTVETPIPSVSVNDDYLSIGFDLMKNDSLGSLKINLNWENVIKTLGEPEEKSETVVWGADGLEHQSWIYTTKGIILDIVKDENSATLNSIHISSPCTFKTRRGIGVGSKRSEVFDAYKSEIEPAESEEAPGFIIAGSIYGGIIFSLENDSVSEIFIGAGAE